VGTLLPFLVFAGGFAAILGGLAWLASRIRRRGGGGAVMGPFEEIWHPVAHRLRYEIQAHEERMVPIPSPGDQWKRSRGDAGQPGAG